MKFIKYQALGNDYIVIPPQGETILTTSEIQRICDRHYGVGADGILWGPLPHEGQHFTLRMFNPDGSEFEKSGNGLRIFARYLWDQALVQSEQFTIMSLGGFVTASIEDNGQRVVIDMGRISFDSTQIPVEGAPRQVINETMTIDGYAQAFRYCAATIGNPHCVILSDEISKNWTMKWGPLIETQARFPNRTNVQFMRVLDRHHIQIEIWERGAGYTLSSGSSSCAAAAVAHRLGLCDAQITVHCPCGEIDISIGADWSVLMAGAVGKICEGDLSSELFALKGSSGICSELGRFPLGRQGYAPTKKRKG
jgi:diaminopimelate epimerase